MEEKPSTTDHWLNQDSKAQLSQFIVEKGKGTVDKIWLSEVIAFINTFPEPKLIISRLDNFWHLLSFHAQANANNELLLAFIDFLKNYQKSHPTIRLGHKIAQYQSEVFINK